MKMEFENHKHLIYSNEQFSLPLHLESSINKAGGITL